MSPLFLLGLLFVGSTTATPDTTTHERPSLRAERIATSERPTIDGNLDEAVWQRAEKGGRFVQYTPNPGEPSTQQTEVAVLYDDNALYVAFWAYDSNPEEIIRRAARRDNFVLSDRVLFAVDPYGDGRTAFGFDVSAAGTKLDLLFFNDTNEDSMWDAVWDVAIGDLPEGGWTAEFRIPLSQIRFTSTNGPQNWRIQFQRNIARNDETALWAPMSPDVQGIVSRFGVLTGIEGLKSPRGLELMPYAATSLDRAPLDEGNPFYSANDFGGSIGLDVRYGISSNLSLNATINPDFGQVEADPATVNLTAYETFLAERRPFFVEGIDVFEFGRTRSYIGEQRPEFFYSRRIGQAPRRTPSGAAYVDMPSQTPILGAAKVSGRVGEWSVGILNATTGKTEARYVNSLGDQETTAVAPFTNYFVGRLQRDFREGASVVGLIGMSTMRGLNDEALRAYGADRALVLGADFEHTWADRAWSFSGVIAASSVSGSPEYIGQMQRAPQRYAHRPDAGHLNYDPDRTHLGGAYTEIALARLSGKFRGSVAINAITSGFDTNDLGFQNRSDLYGINGLIIYNEANSSRSWLQRWSSYAGWIGTFNGDGNFIGNIVATQISGQLSNYWNGGLGVNVSPVDVYDDRLTRGGPLSRRPANVTLNPWANTDSRKSISANGWAFIQQPFSGTGLTQHNGGISVNFRPSATFLISVGPQLNIASRTDQYITSIADETATATFGRRHVFAHMNQRTASMGLRADWIFTPDLTVQLYARPFISSAAFSGFSEFSTPGEHDFAEYGLDRGSIDFVDNRYVITPETGASSFTINNPDFTVRSVLFNAVLRWEYRPGSTLFVVWQQERSGFEQNGSLDLGPNAGRMFTDEARNVFMIKLSYWLGV